MSEADAGVMTGVRADAPFVRAATTRLSYGAIAAYAYWLYAFGPALFLLRGELHLSYTVIGVFSALWAGGAALSGVVFAPIVRRAGRRSTLWGAAGLAVAGAGLFATAHTVVLGLVGAGLLGLAGTTLLSVTQSVLADEHGDRRDRALVEANVAAAACAVVAPPLLGALAVTPIGWRWNFALPAVALALLGLTYRRVALPAEPLAAADRSAGIGALSVRCWLLAVLVALGIAVEFCLIYFGAEQIETTGLSAASATTALGALYVGILAGRIAGAGLTSRPGRTVSLLWASLALTAVGFVLFWLAGRPVLAVAGLLVAGVGIANLYPLSLSLTLASAAGRTDAANALTQLIGGIAVVIAPYLLGALADHRGLHTAFAVELVLIVASALLLLVAERGRTARTERRPVPVRR
jgi:MFS family permease